MFESIVSRITTTIRNITFRVGAALNRSPWMAPAVVVLVLLFAV